jgi:phosphoglycerol transferase MdoB-like AlkP superfamily enzyme
MIFDTTAILYLNAPVLLLLLLPLHWKERPGYYRLLRGLFVTLNFIGLSANLIDCAYFPFTGKRTTASVFQEFSHEGAGELGRIFLGQALHHWYLVLLAFGLVWLLWRLFRPRSFEVQAPTNLYAYYFTHTLVLLLAIPLCIIAIRGGVGKSTRPITISNANEYANRPAETGIILNTPFSILRTIKKTPFQVPDYMTDEEAEALFTPLHEPHDSSAFEPRNVVVLILESFSKQHFGFYNQTLRGGTYQGFTPFLDSLLINNHAMTWRYSYANGRKSIEGMPSVLSALPNYVEPLFLTPASLNHLSGLARELGEHKGYTTAFFHGAQNSSMGFHAFARATGFQQYFGRTEYDNDPETGGNGDFDGTWAIWDEEFLQFYARRMSEMQEPFMTAVFTASSHDPFALPERYHGVFPKGESPLQECIAYSDHALRHFFQTASHEPWFHNTIFVLTADHTSQQLDPFYTTSLGNFCVPIIFYAPGDSTLCGYDEERVVQQTDIMPTLLGLLHYDRPYIAFGNDMLNTPPQETFALHWLPEASGYEFVHGSYLLQFDGQQSTAAYAYRTDSLLQRNILSMMPADTLSLMERQMKSVIQQYMQRMTSDRLTADR